jgi:predicted kinase
MGGFAGSGKTAISHRLAVDLRMPRLGSDTIGHTVRASEGFQSSEGNAQWIAYDVLFRLAEEYIQSGVSTILDMTMGWAFQWRQVDGLLDRHPRTRFLPILLRCPHEVCIARIRQRY